MYREVIMVHRSHIADDSGPSHDRTYPARDFAELSVVTLKKSIDVKGRSLPAGTKGTIVAAYSDGIGYEVEFFEPFHAVVTLEGNDLSA
jgi:hypothetical protein